MKSLAKSETHIQLWKDTLDKGTMLKPGSHPGGAQSLNSATGNTCPWHNSAPIHSSEKTSVRSLGLGELQIRLKP